MAKVEAQDYGKEAEKEKLGKIVNKITAEEREGSISELQGQINYLDHVKENPTKSMDEAVAEVYKTVDRLGGYVTGGTSERDVEEIKKVIEILVEKGVAKGMLKMMLDVMIGKVEKRRTGGKIAENNRILIVFSPDLKNSLITDIPEKP